MNWRLGVRVLAWTGILAGAAWGAKQVNSFLITDSRFELTCPERQATSAQPATRAGVVNVKEQCANLEIHGAVYTNRARIQSVFASDFGASVYRIPLAERRRRLLAVDWVNTATLSRIWPNKLVVTITERHPIAFAKLPIGLTGRYRFELIDAQGVLLSIPSRVRFHLPVLSGINEDQTENDRRMRVEAMEHLLDDLGPDAKDVSEVNAASTIDMRVVTEIDRHAVELWVGDQHYRARYRHFVDNYEEIRRHNEQASVFDLRLDDRILAR